MLFADEPGSNTTAWGAATMILVVLANVIQSWYAKRQADAKAKKDTEAAEMLAAKTDEAAKALAKKNANVARVLVKNAQENKEIIDKIHESVNGTGILGELRKLNERIDDHESKDNSRHSQVSETLSRIILVIGTQKQEEQEGGAEGA